MSTREKLDRIEELSKDKVPDYKYAFHNPYNYSLLGGVAAASLLTGNWWLGIVGLGMEALWMVFGPDSKLLRSKIFDPHHQGLLDEKARAERQAQLRLLPADDVLRFEKLERRAAEIADLSHKNTRLSDGLMREELAKTGKLLEAFLELLQSSARYKKYLATVDADEIDRDMRRFQRAVDNEEDDDRRRLAAQNLSVLEKRRERISELHRFVEKARGQLDLMENTFELLRDQVVSMTSPSELGGQLDDLIDGVEAVRSTAREAASFLESVAQ